MGNIGQCVAMPSQLGRSSSSIGESVNVHEDDNTALVSIKVSSSSSSFTHTIETLVNFVFAILNLTVNFLHNESGKKKNEDVPWHRDGV